MSFFQTGSNSGTGTISSIADVPKELNELYIGQIVLAKYDYKALGKTTSAGDKDISFKKHDRLKILSFLPNNEHWVKVQLLNAPTQVIGVAPRNYLIEPQWLEAMWDYKASGFKMSSGDTDISVNKKDLETCPKDWLKVDLQGKVGVVPKNHFKATTAPPPPPNASKIIVRSKSSDSISTVVPKITNSKDKMMKVLGISGDIMEAIYTPPSPRKKGPEEPEEIKVEEPPTGQNFTRKVVWPSSYPFGLEDSADNIATEVVKESTVIKAANLVKLIGKLTDPGYSDPTFVFEVLLTYRSFTTPKELLELLIQRFNVPTPADVKKDEVDSFIKSIVKPIRIKCLNVIKKWVEQHWYDFEDTSLLDGLKKFLIEATKAPGVEAVASGLSKQIQKQIEGQVPGRSSTLTYTKTPPEPYPIDQKLLATVDSRMTFMAFHPEEIARQLTLIEHELFRAIKPSECLGQNWAKKERKGKAPNILEMIQRFNKVSMWVTSTIVQLDVVKTRAEALTRFIEIAEQLFKLNNFNGTMEVISGLRSAAVHRLKKTWAAISSSKRRLFEELLDLMSPDSNFTKLRTHLHKNIEPPCVPYLGVYLTDLTFLEDGNPDTLNDLINFDKRRRIAAVINSIIQYQQVRYAFTVVPIIRGFLLAGGEYVDENACYKLSLQLESRDGKAVKKVGKSWRSSSITKKKEQINQRSLHNLYNIETPSQRKPSAPEPVAKPTKQSDPQISIDDMVDAMLEGNGDLVDQYLTSLKISEDEKKKIRDDIIKQFEERMENKGATKIPSVLDAPEEESAEIPFDKLVSFLEEDNTQGLETFLEDLDIYEAERIRIQTYKLFDSQKPQQPPKK